MLNKKEIKEVFSISLPVIAEMLLYMIILMIDTAMVSIYGGHIAVSTVGLSSEIIYSISGIIIDVGIAVAVTSFIARMLGEKNIKAAEEYAAIGFYLGLIISIIVSFMLFKFSSEILNFAGANSDVIALGNIYIRVISLGLFFKMLSGILSGILRGYGNTIIPLYTALIVLIINLFLDWLFIFGKLGFKELGIRGSGIAYNYAQVFGFLFLLAYIIQKSKVKIRLKYIVFISIHKFKEFLALCIPTSLEDASFNISRLLSLFIIMHNGTVAFASNQIATTVENLSFMLGYGFSVAATTLVGIKVGEKKYKTAKEYAYICAFFGAVSMLICSFFFLAFPEFLISLFVGKAEAKVVIYGTQCLRTAAVEQPFIGLSLIFAAAMKGSGDTKSPFYISFITSWFIRLPLMFYFIYLIKLPVVYVWWITNLQWCIDSLLMFLMFEKRFKNLNLPLQNL